MGKFTEIYGSAQNERPADIISRPSDKSKAVCPKCKGTDLTRVMGTSTIICLKCRKEITI